MSEDNTMRMSNSPDKGPLELLQLAWERSFGSDSEEEGDKYPIQSPELIDEREADDYGALRGCDHTGGTLLPHSGGHWSGVKPGDTNTSQYFCFECDDIFKVRRKNVAVAKVGNREELVEQMREEQERGSRP